MKRILKHSLIFALLISSAHAQGTSTARLSASFLDRSGAVIPQVDVVLTNDATGLERRSSSQANGTATLPFLPPGTYTLKAERDGFRPAEVRNLALQVGDNLGITVDMEVGLPTESVTVVESTIAIQESGVVGTVIGRQFVEKLPLNGRSFQSLLQLTPGVVPTVAGSQRQGQFSVNGQRESSNYFTVDGVSANLGIQVNGTQFYGIGGEYPGFNAQGGTNSLVSVDALEEFKIQTSTFAPEFGRTPGAQVSIVTRRGGNELHGSAFEYLRNEAFDANDWFANRDRLKKPPMRQNQFGGTLSGPVRLPGYDGRRRTFFFFSQESLRLRLPKVATNVRVPNMEVRQRATGALATVVNAFPVPNAGPSTNGFDLFSASYSDPSRSTATALRLDHNIGGKLQLFGRYNYAPSRNTIRGQANNSLNVLRDLIYKVQTVTLGATYAPTPTLVNDLRLNFSSNDGERSTSTDDFGGGRSPDAASLLPAFANIDSTELVYNLEGTTGPTLTLGKSTNNAQRQWNLVNTTSVTHGGHEIKIGGDFRRLMPVFDYPPYSLFIRFDNPAQALAGVARSVSVSATDTPLYPTYSNLSLFAQDTWRASKRLTLTYGVRYELNPPPGERNDRGILAVANVDNFQTMDLAPAGTPLFKTRKANFAPRVGASYRLATATVLRGGVGVYYDTLPSQIGQAYDPFNAPFGASGGASLVPFPVNPDTLRPPAISRTAPYFGVLGFASDLQLPRSIQANLAVEQSFGESNVLSATYLTAHGQHLYRTESYSRPNPRFTTFRLTKDDATSRYDALQLQLTRRYSRGFQALVSYTLSRSEDNASNDTASAANALIDPEANRGYSDFDRRHTFSAAITYDLPTISSQRLAKAVLGGFSLDVIAKAYSAAPVNVTVNRTLTGDPFNNNTVALRPDVVSGQAVFLDDDSAAGGQRLNPAAFVSPTALRQGTLARNQIRGFGLQQIDLSVRRQFRLTERVALQLRAEAFNVLNQPNFTDPPGLLGSVNAAGTFTPSATFGRSASMLNRGIGGLNSLYQVGGPRSLQLGLRLQF